VRSPPAVEALVAALDPNNVSRPQGLALFFRDPLYVAVLGGLTGGAAQFTAIDRTLIWPHINDTLEEVRVRGGVRCLSVRRRCQEGEVCARSIPLVTSPCAFKSREQHNHCSPPSTRLFTPGAYTPLQKPCPQLSPP
jgi:hypothetical protein